MASMIIPPDLQRIVAVANCLVRSPVTVCGPLGVHAIKLVVEALPPQPLLLLQAPRTEGNPVISKITPLSVTAAKLIHVLLIVSVNGEDGVLVVQLVEAVLEQGTLALASAPVTVG